MLGRSRRGEEVLLDRLQVEGRGRRGGVGAKGGRVLEVKGRLGEACGEKPCDSDGRGVAGCLDPDLGGRVKKKYKLIKRRMSSAKTCDLWLK